VPRQAEPRPAVPQNMVLRRTMTMRSEHAGSPVTWCTRIILDNILDDTAPLRVGKYHVSAQALSQSATITATTTKPRKPADSALVSQRELNRAGNYGRKRVCGFHGVHAHFGSPSRNTDRRAPQRKRRRQAETFRRRFVPLLCALDIRLLNADHERELQVRQDVAAVDPGGERAYRCGTTRAPSPLPSM
jgi:hypothetical protein